MVSSRMSLHEERMKRSTVCSFLIKKQDFTKIKFSSNRKLREENVSTFNKYQYLKATNLLFAKGQYEDALLIPIIWSLASQPNEMFTLRLIDFEDKDGQNLFCIMQTRRTKGRSSLFLKNFIPKL